MSVGLELAKFDMRSISFRPDENKGPVIVLIGRRDTGKSFLVKDLMYYHQDIPIGTVISGTEAGNGFFGEHVPKLFIHDAYNTAIIENILKRQKSVLKQMKKEIEKNLRHAALVFPCFPTRELILRSLLTSWPSEKPNAHP